MASQLLKGHTYNSGDIVDAADLNAHVDNATVLKGAILEQTSVSAAGGDQVLILDASDSNNLKRALVSTLGTGVTSVGLAMPSAEFTITGPNPVTTTGTITVGWKALGFSRNKVLAAPATATGAPSFRTLVPADVTQGFANIGLADIDWSLSNVFAKVMTGNHTFSFSNVRDGQSIKVRLQYPHTGGPYFAHWDSGIQWRGGADPGITASPDAKDIYFFTAIGATVYGYSEKNFA